MILSETGLKSPFVHYDMDGVGNGDMDGMGDIWIWVKTRVGVMDEEWGI